MNTMHRQIRQTGAPWESVAHYSRAVRVGNTIEVAGTTAMQGSEVIGKGDVALQTRYILETIRQVLEEFGSGLEEVVRTRMYVTNIEEWERIGQVHGEFFKGINPAATMVEVRRLIDPDLLIEIEVSVVCNVT